MTTPYLVGDLKRDEGCRREAYQDTMGVWTIGFGHAHVAPGTVWTPQQCADRLAADVAAVVRQLDMLMPWWRRLSDVRQDVLANMAYNLGVGGLAACHHTLALIQAGDYPAAAAHMLTLPWAHQVGGRAQRLARQLRTGVRA